MAKEKKRSVGMDFALGAIGGTAGSLVTYPINAIKAPIEAGLASPGTAGEWVDHTIKNVGDWRKAVKVIPMDVAKKSLALGASWAAIQAAVRQLDKWENKTAGVTMTYKELGFEKTALSSELLGRAAKAALKSGDFGRFEKFLAGVSKAGKREADVILGSLNTHNDPAMIKHIDNMKNYIKS